MTMWQRLAMSDVSGAHNPKHDAVTQLPDPEERNLLKRRFTEAKLLTAAIPAGCYVSVLTK